MFKGVIKINGFNINENNDASQIRNYDVTNQFFQEASKIEPYFKIFKIFSVKDDEIVKLCIAAIRTLAINTDGYFSRSDAINEFSFMDINLAKKVFSYLERYEWIVSNGVNYELPDKVRYFAMFIISALNTNEEDHEKMLAVPLIISELDETIDNDEDISISNIRMLIGALNKVKTELKNILEQKNIDLMKRALKKSKQVRHQIDNIQQTIRRKNKKQYQYIITNMVQSICADIINLYQDLLNFIHDDIQANSKAFGKYLTPEQVVEFLHKCPVERMAALIEKNFSSPHQIMLLTKAEIEKRGGDYLMREIEFEETTAPPPVVKVEKREVITSNSSSDINKFYDELYLGHEDDYEMELKDIVIRENYGVSLYRAGLLVTVKQDIKVFDENKDIVIVNDGHIEVLTNGSVKKITKGIVKIKVKKSMEDI